MPTVATSAAGGLGLGQLEGGGIAAEGDVPVDRIQRLRRAEKHAQRLVVDEPVDVGGELPQRP
jgi:hypothetical protein